MKICFAASGGGHLRQILELSPLWDLGDCFFVSEDGPLLNSFRGPPERLRVRPFALGELKKAGRIRVINRIFRNLFQSLKIVYRSRPDLIISTGAGTVFFTVLFGRILGAKVIIVETFSRYTSLSKFVRLSGWLANERILQTPTLTGFLPGARVFDPIKILPPASFAKEDLILVTVGATLPFDRMVQAMATLSEEARVDSHVMYQVGINGKQPRTGESCEGMSFDALKSVLARAKIVVCHGGSGSIIPALQAGCHVIVFARREKFGEHFDDHQQDLTKAFEARGLVQLAWDADSLATAIERTAEREVVRVTSDMSELSSYLSSLLKKWFPSPL